MGKNARQRARQRKRDAPAASTAALSSISPGRQSKDHFAEVLREAWCTKFNPGYESVAVEYADKMIEAGYTSIESLTSATYETLQPILRMYAPTGWEITLDLREGHDEDNHQERSYHTVHQPSSTQTRGHQVAVMRQSSETSKQRTDGNEQSNDWWSKARDKAENEIAREFPYGEDHPEA